MGKRRHIGLLFSLSPSLSLTIYREGGGTPEETCLGPQRCQVQHCLYRTSKCYVFIICTNIANLTPFEDSLLPCSMYVVFYALKNNFKKHYFKEPSHVTISCLKCIFATQYGPICIVRVPEFHSRNLIAERLKQLLIILYKR